MILLPTDLINLLSTYFCSRVNAKLRTINHHFAKAIKPPPLHIICPSLKFPNLKNSIQFIERLYKQAVDVPKPQIWLTSENIITAGWISIHCPLTIVGHPDKLTNVLGAGFLIQSSNFEKSYFNLSHCIVHSKLGQGIFAQGPLKLKLTHVTVVASKSSGILIRENIEGKLKNCNVYNSTAMGLFVSSSRVACNNCIITGNKWSGVCAVAGSIITLQNSIIQNNGEKTMTGCFDLKASKNNDSIFLDGINVQQRKDYILTKGGNGKISKLH